VVTGSRPAPAALGDAVRWSVHGEPEIATADEGARLCRESGCDVVVAIGGGSVLDTAKAAAALASNGGEALDYLEGVGRGRVLERPSLPFIAVPTTAGSGSEATRNSVLRVPDLKVKRSLRSEFMIPRVALIDPELSDTCPLPVAASAGLDALTHLIEGYVSPGDARKPLGYLVSARRTRVRPAGRMRGSIVDDRLPEPPGIRFDPFVGATGPPAPAGAFGLPEVAAHDAGRVPPSAKVLRAAARRRSHRLRADDGNPPDGSDPALVVARHRPALQPHARTPVVHSGPPFHTRPTARPRYLR
jgi:hypothetical protein